MGKVVDPGWGLSAPIPGVDDKLPDKLGDMDVTPEVKKLYMGNPVMLAMCVYRPHGRRSPPCRHGWSILPQAEHAFSSVPEAVRCNDYVHEEFVGRDHLRAGYHSV